MTKYYENNDHHFEAQIKVYPLGPQTRKTPPFNGIRWAFAYAEDFGSDSLPTTVSDVWPNFLDENDMSIADDIPLFGELKARMHIIFANMIPIHMKRIKIGTVFYCMEGKRKCAQGVVTAVSSHGM